MTAAAVLSVADLVQMLTDSRARTLELVAGLDDDRLMGPCLDSVNPLLWEIGHLAWFHEHFILRARDGRDAPPTDADALYNSATVAHDDRWSLPLPSLDETLAYMNRVHRSLVARLGTGDATAEDRYLYQLTTFHEDMHDEAFTYSRQTLAYPRPRFAVTAAPPDTGPLPGDVAVPGGAFTLGARPDKGFVFDNEKRAHPVDVEPFRIARAPVTNDDFAAFVAAGGYETRAFWDDEGWAWRTEARADQPIYWRRAADGGGWSVRQFDAMVPLAPHQPVIHVNWHEALAWCRWAGRRLPTEIEWEVAAAGEPSPDGGLAATKRIFPWGDEPRPGIAALDGGHLGCVDVAAYRDGESAWGCRQMLGNVWEWTSSPFLPYPDFSPDVYADYSVPSFGTRKVLRGGAWVTRARMVDTSYRNFFPPERRDIYAGFRTVAL